VEASERERAAAVELRDAAIRQAKEDGMSVRAIAAIAGLHPSRVGQILKG
jgi:transposase